MTKQPIIRWASRDSRDNNSTVTVWLQQPKLIGYYWKGLPSEMTDFCTSLTEYVDRYGKINLPEPRKCLKLIIQGEDI